MADAVDTTSNGGPPGGRRIAVYGEIDLNLVDGSAVWLQSVCQVLRSIDGVAAVTLLLRRSIEPERRFLVDPLEAGGVEIVDPGRPGRLAAADALDLLEDLDRSHGPFDVVLLRGTAVLEEAARRSAFDGRLWPYAMTGRGLTDEAVRLLLPRSHRLLCQTDAVADELRAVAPDADGRLMVLPPMIPEPPTSLNGHAPHRDGPLRLVYAGKLSPEYCWLEMADALGRLRETVPDAELHVIGDKVHRPPERPEFHEQAMRALRETDGVRWHGAVPRARVHALLADCDVALSIRDPAVEGTRELSTKVLEYGAAGLPVVLNRAPVYERLLGLDYPLFICEPDDAARILTGSVLDEELRAQAAATCREASEQFTFARVAQRLARELPAARTVPAPPATGTATATRVLAAGHDLKFLGPIRDAIAAAGASLEEDVWANHREHSPRASRAALARADTVLCEWCLENAVWYSHNIRPAQRLAIRFHRMELETDYPERVNLDAVDAVVFVSQHILDGAVERFGWDRDRLRVIPNAVDCERLRRPKRDGSEHVLGMVGYAPMRKRLDLALDLLEKLRRQEPRFRLLVVGQPPSEFGWVVRREDEVERFRHIYERIQQSDLLRGAVDIRPFTDDLPSLLEGIGWIVSTSDSEGHQVALAEGAASGAVPVIIDRPGARDQYPDRWVHASVDDAATNVLDSLSGDRAAESAAAAEHAARWLPERILPQWWDVLGLDGRERTEATALAARQGA